MTKSEAEKWARSSVGTGWSSEMEAKMIAKLEGIDKAIEVLDAKIVDRYMGRTLYDGCPLQHEIEGAKFALDFLRRWRGK